MTLIVNDDNPVAEEVAEQVVEVVEEATDDHKESSEQSIMISTDNSLDRKMQLVPKRSSRTRITATLMAMNVPMIMIVDIVCGQKRDTNHVRQRRIQWEDACYTNDYGNHTASRFHDGVGREKRIAKPVSYKKYLS